MATMPTDWKRLAAALEPPIPSGDLERIAPVLDALEAAFRPLARSLPPDAIPWAGPEDLE